MAPVKPFYVRFGRSISCYGLEGVFQAVYLLYLNILGKSCDRRRKFFPISAKSRLAGSHALIVELTGIGLIGCKLDV